MGNILNETWKIKNKKSLQGRTLQALTFGGGL